MLDDSDKTALLKLARTTLEAHYSDEPTPTCPASHKALTEKKGAFVSLHRGEELRGCIGQLYPDRELIEVVQGNIRLAKIDLNEKQLDSIISNGIRTGTIGI